MVDEITFNKLIHETMTEPCDISDVNLFYNRICELLNNYSFVMNTHIYNKCKQYYRTDLFKTELMFSDLIKYTVIIRPQTKRGRLIEYMTAIMIVQKYFDDRVMHDYDFAGILSRYINLSQFKCMEILQFTQFFVFDLIDWKLFPKNNLEDDSLTFSDDSDDSDYSDYSDDSDYSDSDYSDASDASYKTAQSSNNKK